MNRKKADHITLSYSKFVYAIICAILLFIALIAFIINDPKNDNTQQKIQITSLHQPTVKPTDVSIPTHPPLDNILQANTDTTKWETYTTSDFSFKYPNVKGWEISHSYSPAGIKVSYDCSSVTVCDKSSFRGFSISRLVHTSIEEYKTDGLGKYLTNLVEVTIDGKPAIKGISPGGPHSISHIRYFIVHKGKGYEITYGFSFQRPNKYSDFPYSTPDFVSTLKFTD